MAKQWDWLQRSPSLEFGDKRLSKQENGSLTWRRRAPYKYPHMIIQVQNLDNSALPHVSMWRSGHIAKSAYGCKKEACKQCI